VKLSLIFSFCFALLISCSHEEINLTCADPLGSDTEELKDMQLSCFQEEFFSCFRFELSGADPVIRSLYKTIPSDAPMFFDAGEVQCLSEVTSKISNAWSYALYAQLRHGYVVRMADGTYGRFFIDSWIEGSNGRVTQVNIVRQYSF